MSLCKCYSPLQYALSSKDMECLTYSRNCPGYGILESRHGKRVSTQVYRLETESCIEKNPEAKSKLSGMKPRSVSNVCPGRGDLDLRKSRKLPLENNT